MATPRQIRGRIRVAKNIQQITKAMKMVAAARLRRAQEAVGAARPYAEKMREVLQSLEGAGAGRGVQHPLLRRTEGDARNIGVIVVTGDRGLAGAYNSNIIRRTVDLLRPFTPEHVRLVCVGKRGAAFFRRRGYTIVAEHPVPATGLSFAEAQTLARSARELFEQGEIDALYLIYTQFASAMTQRPQTLQILPIQPTAPGTRAEAPHARRGLHFRAGPGGAFGRPAAALRGHPGLPGRRRKHRVGTRRAHDVHVQRDGQRGQDDFQPHPVPEPRPPGHHHQRNRRDRRRRRSAEVGPHHTRDATTG